MASLVLGIAGEALGSALLGSGFTLFGAAVTGAEIGGAIGALAGNYIDAALAPGTHIKRTGPRLSDVNITSSTEGAPIPRLFGRLRVSGQLVWATNFKETATVTRTSTGGKGFAPSASVTETDYTYSISFAVALCAGEITRIGRVWADGSLIDISQFTTRLYSGSESQSFDPGIEDIEGAGNTPAYRGLAYIVFEDMPLADFGNRIPQLQFEVIRAISDANPDALENRLKGVALIPGAGEFVYETAIVTTDDGEGATYPENAHNSASTADIAASLDELQALAPNMGAVSLVAGWFGNDLRCGSIAIMPGVETADKTTYPESWSVNGIARSAAYVVSQTGGIPNFGGTPSDRSVIDAIADLKARGLRVLFNPFLFLDIAPGNTLADPYTGAAGQPAFPWRGRITCSPAPGVAGSPDKTADAATQVAAFFGAAAATDFTVDGTSVSWSGGSEWSYRRMILHYALLCQAAGGVDAFLIGSELRGLTRVRDGATTYPAVAALKTLAADVRAILGAGTKIGYAADWSEYNNHQTGDAAGALLFNLDPLWSDVNIDFVGIDNYLPLADWRDGTAHLDYNAATGPTAIYDTAYLTANIQGGEDYEWYYAATADRDAQTRTAITDGVGKPWVWRAKDFWNWWANGHYDRADGSESATATDWVPQAKPIWFCELGCPAVDKGANEPNLFYDPKSSESALPYYSNGERDDLIQRRFLEAHLKFWSDAANNPVSSVYGASMVDAANIYAWCWDARPYPFFPARADVWGDAGNWRLGHWLTGRLGAVQLSDLVARICTDQGFADYDTSDLSGLVTGFAITDTMSARDALTPLGLAFHFDAVESEGEIKFQMRGRVPAATLTANDLAIPDDSADFGASFTRAQETDLPLASRITYIDADADYRQAVAVAQRLVGSSDRVATSSLPLVLDQGQAIGIGERLLRDAWVARESASFSLPPSRLALDAADEIVLSASGRDRRWRLSEIDDAGARAVTALATDPTIYEPIVGPSRAPSPASALALPGRALVAFLDLPLLTGGETPWAPWAAGYADPWPGEVLIYRSATTSGYALDTALTKPASIGETTADFHSGAAWRWDDANALEVKLYNGTLASADDDTVLAGANALAVQNSDGAWEIVQFGTAALTGTNTWTLTHLLRGKLGTETAMRDPVAAGARVVVLDGALKQLNLSQNEATLAFNYLWGPQGKAISDPAYQSAALAFAAVGLRPYSPVQVDWQWQDGDTLIVWQRRSRIGNDSWDNVPLGEESESYEVDVLDGAVVVRTLASSEPQVLYAAADQASDFGTLPSSFDVIVYQLSASTGRGIGTRKTLTVR